MLPLSSSHTVASCSPFSISYTMDQRPQSALRVCIRVCTIPQCRGRHGMPEWPSLPQCTEPVIAGSARPGMKHGRSGSDPAVTDPVIPCCAGTNAPATTSHGTTTHPLPIILPPFRLGTKTKKMHLASTSSRFHFFFSHQIQSSLRVRADCHQHRWAYYGQGGQGHCAGCCVEERTPATICYGRA